VRCHSSCPVPAGRSKFPFAFNSLVTVTHCHAWNAIRCFREAIARDMQYDAEVEAEFAPWASHACGYEQIDGGEVSGGPLEQ
jgi:hypothetical protein